MKALEVFINGESIGVYVPPADGCFVANIGNIPRDHMRVPLSAWNEKESWEWQLPDIYPGQEISFKLVDARVGSGIPPDSVTLRDPVEVAENKKEGAKLYAKAKRRMAAAKKRRKA